MPMPRSASSSDDKASFLKASRIPSIRPIGMPSARYSGSRLASIRQTTLTGPPASTTYWKSRSILSRTRSMAARTSEPSSGTAMDFARYRSIKPICRNLDRPDTIIWPQRRRTRHNGREHRPQEPYSNWLHEFMSKSPSAAEMMSAEAARAERGVRRPRIALLSNPKSTGNLAQLPRIREYCADHPDVFHYEVEQASQIGEAMKVIARVRPKVLAINGGDGTVQATLTEIYNGGHFGDTPP